LPINRVLSLYFKQNNESCNLLSFSLLTFF